MFAKSKLMRANIREFYDKNKRTEKKAIEVWKI